jgi:hypothetical protein
MQLKYWPLVLLAPILIAPFSILAGFHRKSTDFDQCKQTFLHSPELHSRYNYTGPVTHLPFGIPRGFLITLEGCQDVCGRWPDFYIFSTWSSAVTTWVSSSPLPTIKCSCLYLLGPPPLRTDPPGPLLFQRIHQHHSYVVQMARQPHVLHRSYNVEHTRHS